MHHLGLFRWFLLNRCRRQGIPKKLFCTETERLGKTFQHGKLEVFATSFNGLIILVIAPDEGGHPLLSQPVPMTKLPHSRG